MKYGVSLIDKAAKVCGGYSALAERMGIPVQNVSLMKSGKRAISPATAAELADIAGDDAREAAITAIIDSAKGTRREGALRAILGKGLAAGVAGMLVFSYSSDSISAMESRATTGNPLYIVFIRLARLARGCAARASLSGRRILSHSYAGGTARTTA